MRQLTLTKKRQPASIDFASVIDLTAFVKQGLSFHNDTSVNTLLLKMLLAKHPAGSSLEMFRTLPQWKPIAQNSKEVRNCGRYQFSSAFYALLSQQVPPHTFGTPRTVFAPSSSKTQKFRSSRRAAWRSDPESAIL